MATKKPVVKALRVTARRDSFRRIGRTFGADPVDIPLSDLKKEEIAALHADRMLVVSEVEIEAADTAAASE
jgi:hypothetical protein